MMEVFRSGRRSECDCAWRICDLRLGGIEVGLLLVRRTSRREWEEKGVRCPCSCLGEEKGLEVFYQVCG